MTFLPGTLRLHRLRRGSDESRPQTIGPREDVRKERRHPRPSAPRPASPPVLRLGSGDGLSPRFEWVGWVYGPCSSHPLYRPAQGRHTVGAAGVQEAVACRCLITAETARSVAGQYPAGSAGLPASGNTHTYTHTQTCYQCTGSLSLR